MRIEINLNSYDIMQKKLKLDTKTNSSAKEIKKIC